MKSFGVFELIFLIAVFHLSLGNKSCDKEFRKEEYIPKFADGIKDTNLEVRYDHRVKCGEKVSVLEARKAPTLKFDVKDKCKNITVLAFQPDALVNAPYPIWLVHNVPPSVLKTGFANGGNLNDIIAGRNQGDVRANYIITDDPTAGSGVRELHLAYFIYCQCKRISDLRKFNRIDRLKFDVKPYMKKHGLKRPVAGLFHEISFTGLPIPELPVQAPGVEVPAPIDPSKVPVPLP